MPPDELYASLVQALLQMLKVGKIPFFLLTFATFGIDPDEFSSCRLDSVREAVRESQRISSCIGMPEKSREVVHSSPQQQLLLSRVSWRCRLVLRW